MAKHHEAAVYDLNRQLQAVLRFRSGEEARSSDAIRGCLRAILAVFKTIYREHEEEFSANLMVPNADHSQLWLVVIEPGGRGRTTKLPRSIDVSSWGVGQCLQSQEIVCTPDVRECGKEGTTYLSVVNLPVVNEQGKVSAIVNIDSPQVEAFGTKDRVQNAFAYCAPIIATLALCLKDERLFRTERSSTK